MKTPIRRTFAAPFSTLLAISLVSPLAPAQEVFRRPGRIQVAPTETRFDGLRGYGSDANGFFYVSMPVGGAVGLGCFRPEDPTGTLRTFRLGFSAAFEPTELEVLFSADRTSADVVAYGTHTSAELVHFYRLSCADMVQNDFNSLVGITELGTIRPSEINLYANGIIREVMRLEGRTFCFGLGFDLGIVCADTSMTPARVYSLVDLDSLDEAVDVDPGLGVEAWDLLDPPEHEGWSLRAPIRAPVGGGAESTFFFADRLWIEKQQHITMPPLTVTHRYVLERTDDGRIINHLGPIPATISSWGPLDHTTTLAYSVELDAIVAYPETLGEYHTNMNLWVGRGFRVLPLQAPGSGYLGISEALAIRLGCNSQYSPIPCYQENGLTNALIVDGDGHLQIAIKEPGSSGTVPRYRLHTITFEADQLDLDDDLLSAAEERTQGTWDTIADSDDAGTPDGIEVKLSKTDPKDPKDEPSQQFLDNRPVQGTVTYTSSSMIRGRLPNIVNEAATPGMKGPLCVNGVCYGPDGKAVARYPADVRATVSLDGKYIMWWAPEGLMRLWFSDGRRELAIPIAEINRVISGEPLYMQLYPVDARQTWIIRTGQMDPVAFPALVAVSDGPTLRVAYNHTKAQRDSGLSVSSSDFLTATYPVQASISVSGFNPVTRQLHIGVRGLYETFLLGVGEDGETTLLGRGRAISGANRRTWYNLPITDYWYVPPIPSFMFETKHGDFFTLGGLMEPYGTYRSLSISSYSALDPRPLAFWGDVILESLCCGTDEDGVYELVRYDRSAVMGDTWSLVNLSNQLQGSTFYRSGPRGGVAPMVDEPFAPIRAIGGMDLSRDRKLCVADSWTGDVYELEGGPDTIPNQVINSYEVPGVLDCAYSGDSLYVLATDPPRALVRTGKFGQLEPYPVPSLDENSQPLAWVHAPEGKLEVLTESDGLRGKTYLPDGRAVTMGSQSNDLLVDGRPVATIDRLLFNNLHDPPFPASHRALVDLEVRPDGLILVAAREAAPSPPYATLSHVYAVDPGTGSVSKLFPEPYCADRGLSCGIALLVVPGGIAADPWTGRATGTTTRQPSDVDVPTAPVAPTQGEKVVVPEGCSSTRPEGGPWLLMALLAVRRRRFRTRSVGS